MRLTRHEAENAVSLSLTRHNRLQAYVRCELKSQALQTTGLVRLYRGGERFDDLGGLAALKAFRFAGAVPIPVESDDDGPTPEALVAAIAEHDPALLYLVPTFQNPTGRTIPAARRAALTQVDMVGAALESLGYGRDETTQPTTTTQETTNG